MNHVNGKEAADQQDVEMDTSKEGQFYIAHDFVITLSVSISTI
jgi:hypothetical protein